MPIPIIIGAVAAAAGAAGAIGQQQDAKKAAAGQNRVNTLASELSYQSQLRDYGFQVADLNNQLAYAQAKAKQEIEIAKASANQEWQFNNAVQRFNYIRESTNAQLDWQYQTAAQQMDWQLQQTLQDAEYRSSIRAFEQSEKTFAEQVRLNSLAAGRAYEGAQTQMRLSQAQAALEADTLRTQTAKQQGAVAASGRSGASMARLAMDAQQQYGRDLGLLATNLAFAKTDFALGQMDGWLSQQSANAEAQSRRMLRPMDKINIPQPVGIPQAYIPQPIDIPKPIVNQINPIVPDRIIAPPEPIKGPVPIARAPSTLGLIGNIGTSIVGGIGTANSLTPGGLFQ
jgi:hypothetical protein